MAITEDEYDASTPLPIMTFIFNILGDVVYTGMQRDALFVAKAIVTRGIF